MANQDHQQEAKPKKKNEAPNNPKIRERAKRLSEKVSELDHTLDEIEETLEKEP